MDPFVLVVMERASVWPVRVNGAAGCIALRQEPRESYRELLQRVCERVRTIERIGGVVEAAVLSCSDECSEEALDGRVPLARALLAAVLQGSGGRLELVAREGTPEHTRHAVLALAGTLTEALAGTSTSVSARFCEPRAKASLPRPKRKSLRMPEGRRSAA